MAYVIGKVDVWVGSILDRPGGLAEKLAAVSAAGANLEFLIARRAPDQPGAGVVFLAPLKGAAQQRAGKKAGLTRSESLHSLRLEGPDRPGLSATITRALEATGINLRGLSAAAMGRRCVVYFAFDTAVDARKAASALKKALKN